MDLPLEALKMVSETAPPQDGSNHNLIWTPENGFILSIAVGGQFQPIRFDFDDKIGDIKEEIMALTGIPMPEQKKSEKKEDKKEGPPMDKEASKTPLLDSIKEAVLGETSYAESVANRAEAGRSALQSAGLGNTPSRTTRPGLLTRINDFRTRVMADKASARNQ